MIVSSVGPKGSRSVSRDYHPCELRANGDCVDVWFTDWHGEKVFVSLAKDALQKALKVADGKTVRASIEFDTPIR